MIPGIDSKGMAKLMAQMGVKTQDVECSKVIIELKDNSKIVVLEPQVIQIEMRGQKLFQVSGKITEQQNIDENDIKLVVENTGCTEEEAKNALIKSEGNLAEAILSLKKE